MKRLSRTRLFLLEMMVNLLIFCVCAAICLMTFSHAYSLSAESRAAEQAQRLTENAAAAFRASGGDLTALPGLLSGRCEGDSFTAWYSQDGQPVRESRGIYRLTVRRRALDHHVLEAHIAVWPPEGDAIVRLTVKQYTGTQSEAGA